MQEVWTSSDCFTIFPGNLNYGDIFILVPVYISARNAGENEYFCQRKAWKPGLNYITVNSNVIEYYHLVVFDVSIIILVQTDSNNI